MLLCAGALAIGVGLTAMALRTLAATGRILDSQIHGVQPFDPLTLVAAGVFLAACGAAATWWPARRAATGDVLAALKAE